MGLSRARATINDPQGALHVNPTLCALSYSLVGGQFGQFIAKSQL
jgi:hypothetical protein